MHNKTSATWTLKTKSNIIHLFSCKHIHNLITKKTTLNWLMVFCKARLLNVQIKKMLNSFPRLPYFNSITTPYTLLFMSISTELRKTLTISNRYSGLMHHTRLFHDFETLWRFSYEWLPVRFHTMVSMCTSFCTDRYQLGSKLLMHSNHLKTQKHCFYKYNLKNH